MWICLIASIWSLKCAFPEWPCSLFKSFKGPKWGLKCSFFWWLERLCLWEDCWRLRWSTEREPLQEDADKRLHITGGIALLAGASLSVLCSESQAEGSRDRPKKKKKLRAGSRFWIQRRAILGQTVGNCLGEDGVRHGQPAASRAGAGQCLLSKKALVPGRACGRQRLGIIVH